MNQFLICYDSNDCNVISFNGTLKQAQEYFIGTKFFIGVGLQVIDVNKPFKVEVPSLNKESNFKFIDINYNNQIDFKIKLENLTEGEIVEVEPNWFYNHKRIITQGEGN